METKQPANQGRAGTREEAGGKVDRRREEAANRDAAFLCGREVLILHVNFGVDDWSQQAGQCRHHKR